MYRRIRKKYTLNQANIFISNIIYNINCNKTQTSLI